LLHVLVLDCVCALIHQLKTVVKMWCHVLSLFKRFKCVFFLARCYMCWCWTVSVHWFISWRLLWRCDAMFGARTLWAGGTTESSHEGDEVSAAQRHSRMYTARVS